MKTEEIRKRFVEYFISKGHTHVKSSSLIPEGDPTLLFTNAGMVQFKRVFLGEEKRGYTRATSVQKCLRAGGKHNDLENVGRTLRHHTFFEMLGNFSFGDYFKEQAIEMAWEFLTDVVGLDKNRLWITIFKDDDEAGVIWKDRIGIAPERIVRMGEEDNFWSMGDTGPCGPCSEIVIDQGEDMGCGRPECAVGCSCDRYLEIWNLVFMQYNRDTDGRMTGLPAPSIDTGMGLERLASIIQGVDGDYEIDIFKGIIKRIEDLCGKGYHTNTRDDFSIRVIADHSRAIAFLLAEGLLPSNEGRGYVLRRILRRAARHGRRLGIERAFLTDVVEAVIKEMGEEYPELIEAREFMGKVIHGEEERFFETLDRGLLILDEMIAGLKEKGEDTLPGGYAFRLYDTYGFPIDITLDIAEEEGLKVDMAGFEREMGLQKKRSRESWRGDSVVSMEEFYRGLLNKGIKTEFIGYTHERSKSEVIAIIKGDSLVDSATQGDSVGIIVKHTPFYGESGGQVGDRGIITGEGLMIEIDDTKRPLSELIIHLGRVLEGEIHTGDEVELLPDISSRKATSLNHTATHLLHAVLRKNLGSHVRQSGSLVAPDRLRFDFTHFSGLTDEQISTIEEEVNRLIREDSEVRTDILTLDEAIERGAMALFDEKYGDKVRLVAIDDVSKELCGGIHAKRTGEIGLFKIINETAIAAGVRRIEAETGEYAYRFIKEEEALLDTIASRLRSDRRNVVEKIDRLLSMQKEMEKELLRLKERLKAIEVKGLLDGVREVDGIKVLSTVVDADSHDELRQWADRLKGEIGKGVIILGSRCDDRALILVTVAKEIASRLSASEIVKILARGIDGKGGGRADMAQAGGRNPSGLEKTIKDAYRVVERFF